MTVDPDLPRVRALALGAVVLVVAAAGAATGDARVPVLVVTSAVLAFAARWHWRRAGRTGLSTSAAVAAVLVALLLVERVTGDVDTVLAVASAVALAAAVVLRERRLAVSGLLTLAVLLGRPATDGATFAHCLVATDVAVPVPRLDGPLWLAVGATVLGTALRWGGWGRRLGRASVARGVEITGGAGLVALLLAKAAELPGHRLLCGPGDALDEGWALAAIGAGIVAGLYGLAATDVAWEAIGLVGVAGQALLATLLTGSPWWAVGGAVVLVSGLAAAEILGVPWPERPGYEVARPTPADLRARATARRARTAAATTREEPS